MGKLKPNERLCDPYFLWCPCFKEIKVIFADINRVWIVWNKKVPKKIRDFVASHEIFSFLRIFQLQWNSSNLWLLTDKFWNFFYSKSSEQISFSNIYIIHLSGLRYFIFHSHQMKKWTETWSFHPNSVLKIDCIIVTNYHPLFFIEVWGLKKNYP